MNKVVVTYFEPFGGRTTNASKEVVTLLSNYQIKELPVSWEKVPSLIDEILSNEPDYLFLVGEAGSYKEISMEKYAHNIAHGVDNSGVNKDNEPIINGGTDILTTTFDLSKLPYRISENAGRYLCNYTYYQALLKSKKTKVLFIHLPYIDEANNTLANLKDALSHIIEELIK
jgi:pyroglutamyl-peptidase